MLDKIKKAIGLAKILWKLKEVKLTMPSSWRKATAAVVAATIKALGPHVGIPEDVCDWLVSIAIAFILGQGLADIGKSAALIANGKK